MSIWEFANPVRFMRLSGKILPWVSVLAAVTLLAGIIWGFFFTGDAVNFGSTVKIIPGARTALPSQEILGAS